MATFDIILSLLAFCIFTSNLVVLVAIIKAKHLHIPSNIFVAGMALADVTVGAIGLPIRVIVEMHLEIDYHSCLYLNCIYLYTLALSLYMLLAFTFDRLYAIRFPYKYRQRVKCKDDIIALSVIWTVGLVEAFIPALIVEDNQIEAYEGMCSIAAAMPLVYIVYVNFFGKVVGSLLILIIVNTYILYVVGRHIRSNTLTSKTGRNNVRTKDLKAEKMLVGMIAVFFTCRLPINIALAVKYFGGHVDIPLYLVFLIMYYLTSFLNPFIYAVSNTRIKKACENAILCRPLNRTMNKMSDDQISIIGSRRSKKTPAGAKSNRSKEEGSTSQLVTLSLDSESSRGTVKTEMGTSIPMNILWESRKRSKNSKAQEADSWQALTPSPTCQHLEVSARQSTSSLKQARASTHLGPLGDVCLM